MTVTSGLFNKITIIVN